MRLSDSDFHPHIIARMGQRGVTRAEVEESLRKGKDAKDAKSGTRGKSLVMTYNEYWEGRFYPEKKSPSTIEWQATA